MLLVLLVLLLLLLFLLVVLLFRLNGLLLDLGLQVLGLMVSLVLLLLVLSLVLNVHRNVHLLLDRDGHLLGDGELDLLIHRVRTIDWNLHRVRHGLFHCLVGWETGV